MRKRFHLKSLLVLATIFVLFVGTPIFAEPWSFGVMGDTQWTCPDDPTGMNPNGVAVSIIRQINRQFIRHGVKFVIQVGDLTENGNDADISERAKAAQDLYGVGIGFFPMRGNHETNGAPANNFGIPAFRANFPQTCGLSRTFGAHNFSSPTYINADLQGMTYSFDYGAADNNARFVILDNWATPSKKVMHDNGYNYGYSIGDQQSWVSNRLDKDSRDTLHAFVFSHQPLIAENHQDSPFTGYTDANPAMQNVFFASLRDNSVQYYISGHDHIHQRSIISSPNGMSRVQEIICASNSSKFYTPKALNDPKWYDQKGREISLSQERYTIGYYIFSVDGPRVTVDYYSDDTGNWQSDKNYPSGPSEKGTHVTPVFNFIKKETWGYSLNGKEFLVCQKGQPECDSSYTQISDTFQGTTVRILDGMNTSTEKDYNKRPLTKSVCTGWTSAENWHIMHPANKSHHDYSLLSDVLTLWGIADLGSNKKDKFALSMSYDDCRRLTGQCNDKVVAILVSRNGKGDWVNAVDMNYGGSKQFIFGPWKSGYKLGTYGIDRETQTAWAVINYDGDFAVSAEELD